MACCISRSTSQQAVERPRPGRPCPASSKASPQVAVEHPGIEILPCLLQPPADTVSRPRTSAALCLQAQARRRRAMRVDRPSRRWTLLRRSASLQVSGMRRDARPDRALRRARLWPGQQAPPRVEAGHWYRLGAGGRPLENLRSLGRCLPATLGLALAGEAGPGADLDAAFKPPCWESSGLMQQRHVPDPLYRGALLLVSSALTLQQGRPAQAREILLRVRAYFPAGTAGALSPPSEPELEARVEHQLALAELLQRRAAAAEARLPWACSPFSRRRGGRRCFAKCAWVSPSASSSPDNCPRPSRPCAVAWSWRSG